MFCVIDSSLTLLNTSCGIYSISKEFNSKAVLLSINNETQCVPLLCLSSRFMTYALSFILDKLSLEKNTIKHRHVIEILCNLDIA